MVYLNILLNVTCIVTILVAIVYGVKKTIELQADYNAKLKNIVDQVNDSEKYQYYMDKKASERMKETDATLKDVINRYASKSKMDAGMITDSVDIGEIVKADRSGAQITDIQFSPQVTRYTNRAVGNAEIANDVKLQNKLVFVGNKSDGAGDRKIGLLDKLDVYGNLEVDGSSVGMDISSQGVVKVGQDSAWMRPDGYIYGGNLINSKDVLGYSAIKLGNDAAVISRDGNINAKGSIKADDSARGYSIQARQSIQAGNSSMNMAGKIDGKNLCIDGACVGKSDVLTMKNQMVPVNCALSDWSGWGGCTRPCGGGKRYRMRSVLTPSAYSGSLCSGQTEEQECNSQACPDGFVYDETPKDCVIGDWTVWGECNKSCGGGLQYRLKSVLQQPANGGAACVEQEMIQSRVCNTVACQVIQNSTILDGSHDSAIRTLLNTNSLGTLLYRATRDGFSTTAFKNKCYGVPNLFIVAKSTTGYIATAFTPVAFTNAGTYIAATSGTAWLNNLSTPSKVISTTKFLNTNNNSGTIYDSRFAYGPIFGTGHDWFIDSDMKSGYTNPSAYNNNGYTKTSLFGEYNTWTLSEIEIYHIFTNTFDTNNVTYNTISMSYFSNANLPYNNPSLDNLNKYIAKAWSFGAYRSRTFAPICTVLANYGDSEHKLYDSNWESAWWLNTSTSSAISSDSLLIEFDQIRFVTRIEAWNFEAYSQTASGGDLVVYSITSSTSSSINTVSLLGTISLKGNGNNLGGIDINMNLTHILFLRPNVNGWSRLESIKII